MNARIIRTNFRFVCAFFILFSLVNPTHAQTILLDRQLTNDELLNAVHFGDIAMVKFYFSKGGEPNAILGNNWMPMIVLAARVESKGPEKAYRLVEFLLEKGADPNKVVGLKETAILMAARQTDPKEGPSWIDTAELNKYMALTIKTLKQAGAKIELKDHVGESALTLAESGRLPKDIQSAILK